MKAYTKLRVKMVEQDIHAYDLANLLNRSESYVSQRMSGRNYYWDLKEAYIILDFLGIPFNEIAEYFPPNKGLPERRCKSA